MDKYIKISDLKSKLNYIFRSYGVGKSTKEAINNVIRKIPYVVKEELETTIEYMPEEDVAPVVHGKWVRVDDNKERCSNCETIYCIYSYPYKRNNYCPNCGAKMEE